MRRISLLLLLSTLLVPLVSAPSAPAASKACNIETIIAEAYQNASVSPGYSVSCLYRARVAAANDADIATYSDVDQVLRVAIAKAGGTPKPIPQTPTAPERGTGTRTGTGTTTKPAPTATATPSSETLVDRPTGDSGGVPAPVIALGIVAVAAVLAAAVVELRRRRT